MKVSHELIDKHNILPLKIKKIYAEKNKQAVNLQSSLRLTSLNKTIPLMTQKRKFIGTYYP